MPEGTQRILNARSLQTAHRRLAALLRPGLTVLDLGCGTGAITRDIAAAVTPHRRVVGVDVNAALIEEARRVHGAVSGLSFEVCDVYHLPYQERFDVVYTHSRFVPASISSVWLVCCNGWLTPSMPCAC